MSGHTVSWVSMPASSSPIPTGGSPANPPSAPFRRWPGLDPQPYWAYESLFVSPRWAGQLVASSHAATDRAIRPSRGGPAGRLIRAKAPASIWEKLRLLRHLVLSRYEAEAQAALLAWGQTAPWLPALGILRGGPRRERWMGHPQAPGWAWSRGFLAVFRGRFTLPRQVAHLLLQAPPGAQSQQRSWCEPDARTAEGTSRWRDGLQALGQALTEFDVSPRPLSVGRVDPHVLRALLDLPWSTAQRWRLLCLVAEDPRPWPNAHWQAVLQQANAMAPDPAQDGSAHVAYVYAMGGLAARLAIRADLEASTVAHVARLISTLPPLRFQGQVAKVLSETDDLNWTGLGTRCEGLLRLAGGATGERVHHADLMEAWLVEELRGGPERPPQDRAPIWKALHASPRWLLSVAEAVRHDPVLAEEAAIALRALSPQALRPLLVSPSQDLRLLAVRALGHLSAQAAPIPPRALSERPALDADEPARYIEDSAGVPSGGAGSPRQRSTGGWGLR